MFTVGITGGIGCGKSEVCAWLEKKDRTGIFYADKAGHEVMMPGGECYDRLVSILGSGHLCADGTIDRRSVGELVFNDRQTLAEINAVIHPAVFDRLETAKRRSAESGCIFFFAESAIMFQSGCDRYCDEVWYVYAGREVRWERIREREGMTRERFESINKNQMSDHDLRRLSDLVIDNSRDFSRTCEQIERRLREMCQ